MDTTTILKKKLLPKAIILVFLIIAFEIFKLFPLMDKPILGPYLVIMWLHAIKSVFFIAILVGSFNDIRELVIAIFSENFKEKYFSWTEDKKKSLSAFIFDCLVVALVLISYAIISMDLTIFITNTTLDILVMVLILISGVLFVYKAYVDLKKLLEMGKKDETTNQEDKNDTNI